MSRSSSQRSGRPMPERADWGDAVGTANTETTRRHEMFAANSYRIRIANGQDADAVRDLIERNCAQSLSGQLLIGELDGVVAAAMSLSDGRVIADDSQRT